MNEGIMEFDKDKALAASKAKRAIYHAIKRAFDIVCALIGLAFLIPITWIVKICYMLTGDFKTIFYAQPRIGKNGKVFYLFKFRSMVPDADKKLKELLESDPEAAREYKLNKKLEHDPRITKVGKIIRKLSIDEIPQFVNILLGEMTLIGNRPYLPREKKDMGSYYDDIIKTKPGLTGYWQVSLRSRGTFEDRLKLEKYYSNNAGLRMDIKIFFKTFKVVLSGKDAK